MEDRIYAWILILTHLPGFLIRVIGYFLSRDLLSQILAVALEMNLETYVQILASLAPHLSRDLRDQALEVFRSKKDIKIIKYLASYLEPHQLDRVLAISKEINDPTICAEVIDVLFKHSKIANNRRLFYKSLVIILSIQNEPASAKALAALAPYLTKELASLVLAEISEIPDEDSRSIALSALISHYPRDNLSIDLLVQALDIAFKIKKADACIKALDDLIPYLPQDLRDQGLAKIVERLIEPGDKTVGLDRYIKGLEYIKKIHNKTLRADTLINLARYLPMEEMGAEALAAEALAITQEIQDTPSFAKALAILSARLPSNLLPKALVLAREIENKDARAQALAALASRLAKLPRRDLYPLWDETLRHLARRTCDDLITDLKALEPIIRALGGEEAIAETFRAIRGVARWWP
jgi:uncharacterized protein YeeX (DUF496 family)